MWIFLKKYRKENKWTTIVKNKHHTISRRTEAIEKLMIRCKISSSLKKYYLKIKLYHSVN